MTETGLDIKTAFIQHIRHLQDAICDALEKEDGKAVFIEDKWIRSGGGGGRTRVIQNGDVFEKGGVNISEVEGSITAGMKEQLQINGEHFFAAGLSLVIHPFNPFVPTVHANIRYFEIFNDRREVTDSWFGGGADLTPYYVNEEDIKHFHGTFKRACENFDPNFYADFKTQCDEYFVNRHRNTDRRGAGGIFFDYKRPSANMSGEFWMNFAVSCGEALLKSYLPIVSSRKNLPFSALHKRWQEIRRGRYVEFNLVHDRGTLFGLKTNGRTESILMSLPPTVRFDYNYQPEPGSEEDKLLQICLHPRQWV